MRFRVYFKVHTCCGCSEGRTVVSADNSKDAIQKVCRYNSGVYDPKSKRGVEILCVEECNDDEEPYRFLRPVNPHCNM